MGEQSGNRLRGQETLKKNLREDILRNAAV